MPKGKKHCWIAAFTLFFVVSAGFLIVTSCRPSAPVDTKNVVLISIDTCRADRLSCYGYERSTTPNIDSVARDGFLFERAVSPVPITLPSHSSIMTGTIPPHHGVRDNVEYRLDDSLVTLAELMKQGGYKTAAFVGAMVLESRFGLDQGFDTYDDRFLESREDIFLERRGSEVSRVAGSWLEENRDGRNFLFLHYFDPHANYRPPEPFASEFADEPYAGEVAYTDWCIGEVIHELKSLDLYDSSLIIITADHGEALGEHSELTHAYYIYQSTLRVPLIVKPPGSHEGGRIDDTVSLIDIMPTVLDFVGIPIPAAVQGEALSAYFSSRKPAMEPRSLYSESLLATKYGCSPLFAVLDGRWKYIHTSVPELYDLEEDPSESTNLAAREVQNATRLHNRLEQILREQTRKEEIANRALIDASTRARLRALGYHTGGSIREDIAIDAGRDDPKDFFPYYLKFQRATYLYGQGRQAEAKELVNELLSEKPDMAQALNLMGNIYYDEADLRRASDCFTRALENAPDYLDAHIDLGVVLAQQGKMAESVAHLSDALRLNPSSVVAHNNMGNALASQGRLEEALGHYEKALEIDPAYPDAYLNSCRVLGMQERLDEALQYCREALRLAPGWEEAENVYRQYRTRLEKN